MFNGSTISMAIFDGDSPSLRPFVHRRSTSQEGAHAPTPHDLKKDLSSILQLWPFTSYKYLENPIYRM